MFERNPCFERYHLPPSSVIDTLLKDLNSDLLAMRLDTVGGLAYPQKPHHCKSSFDSIIFVEKWSCRLTHRRTRRAVLEMFADFATCFRIKNVKVSKKVEQKLFIIKKTG